MSGKNNISFDNKTYAEVGAVAKLMLSNNRHIAQQCVMACLQMAREPEGRRQVPMVVHLISKAFQKDQWPEILNEKLEASSTDEKSPLEKAKDAEKKKRASVKSGKTSDSEGKP